MDSAWLARMRWRRRGAWLWPAFAVVTAADALVGHALPPAGESEDLFGAALSSLWLNLIAVVLVSVPLGAVLRRRRRDLPRIVARDYAGACAVGCVALALLLTGIVHRSSVLSNRHEMQDAITRAQAWIGDRAPAEFRRNLQEISTSAIEPGSMYRTCVLGAESRRTYCVIVNTKLPFARSVRFSGYEPNSVLAVGTG